MSNWKEKSSMNKLHSTPCTGNIGVTSSQHSTAKDAWKSYFSGEKIISLSSETTEPPTYFNALPSRPKRAESTTMMEYMANQKKSLSAEYPFASSRGDNPRIRMKNESLSLDKFKSIIANAKSREKRKYICCHCQSSSNSTRIGSHCLSEFHIKYFNEGIDCPNCFKYTE
ncbi:hypothetical protein HPULCUR_007074 [Helicostylum pulchrum]|uniref:Uncharacterized protein n=1 Tax=Helicostylum pulchrum TaxID=562976 RepID=A0ABP9Y3U5_9FUNG